MFIQPHQLHEILSPKRGCQRGLEEYIVAQHRGDRQVYTGDEKPGYAFMNNPVYRVGKEGDPSPGTWSSRTYPGPPPNLKLSDSALHLLYPTIDSGSVFLSEQPWSSKWYSNMTNISNTFGDE